MNELSELIDNYNKLYARQHKERYYIRTVKDNPNELVNYLNNEISNFNKSI